MAENYDCSTVVTERRYMEIRSKRSFGVMKELYEKNGVRALFAGNLWLFDFSVKCTKEIFSKYVKKYKFSNL